MKVAVVMTVKNEVRLLRQNALYHLGIGVTKLFVYFDGTTDDGAQRILDIENIEINDSVAIETYEHLQYLEKFWSNAKEHHTARQCLNTYDALQKCKAQQIDWLISLDADELFLSSKDGSITINQFFQEAIKQDADIINLKPMEVLARQMNYFNVMAEETLFKTQKNFKSKLDQIYQKIYNPYANTFKTVSFWLGHTMGKSAIRVSNSIVPINVHRYTAKDDENLKVIQRGYILHYHIYDYRNFVEKFQNFKERSETYLSGHKINNLKSLWIKIVNDENHSSEYLEAYFEKYLLFDTIKLKRLKRTRLFNLLKRRETAVITIDYPKRILSAVHNRNT